MVEDDLDPQPHGQGARDCFDFLVLLSMVCSKRGCSQGRKHTDEGDGGWISSYRAISVRSPRSFKKKILQVAHTIHSSEPTQVPHRPVAIGFLRRKQNLERPALAVPGGNSSFLPSGCCWPAMQLSGQEILTSHCVQNPQISPCHLRTLHHRLRAHRRCLSNLLLHPPSPIHDPHRMRVRLHPSQVHQFREDSDVGDMGSSASSRYRRRSLSSPRRK